MRLRGIADQEWPATAPKRWLQSIDTSAPRAGMLQRDII
jgi:hypothetical protein